MPNNKTILTIGLCMFFSGLMAQEPAFTALPSKRGNYSLVAHISGGVGYYVSNRGTPAYLKTELQNLSRVYNIRVMWHPDHLVKLGLETGQLNFYSYRLWDSAGREGRVDVRAIPLLVEWSMALGKRMNVFAGSGVYFLTTKLDYLGKTNSKKLSVGWMAAASYIHPLSKNAGLGTELKWFHASEAVNGSLILQLQLVWRFLQW
jgi:hypothetical protein